METFCVTQLVSQSDGTARKRQNREVQRTVTFFPSRILACGLLQNIFILPRGSRARNSRRLEQLQATRNDCRKNYSEDVIFTFFSSFLKNFGEKLKFSINIIIPLPSPQKELAFNVYLYICGF